MESLYRFPMDMIRREFWANAILGIGRNIWGIIVGGRGELCELENAVTAIGWGIWFLLPFYDSTVTSFPVFHVMLRNIPNHAWAGIFFVLGIGQILGLGLGRHDARRFWSQFAITVWAAITWMLAMGEWRAVSCLNAGVSVLFALLANWKLGISPSAVREPTRVSKLVE